MKKTALFGMLVLAARIAEAQQPPVLIKDIDVVTPTINVLSAYSMSAIGRELYFSGTRGPESSSALWKSDGTPAGTKLVRDLPTGPIAPLNATQTLFAGYDIQGYELWSTDGTPSGTRLVKDISPGVSSSQSAPGDLTPVNGTMFFTARVGFARRALWKSNGTEVGTVLVKDTYPGVSADLTSLTALGTRLLFNRLGLWASDGTDSGTIPLGVSVDFSAPAILVVGDRAYFSGSASSPASELWTTDGTPTGTHVVKEINPGSFGSHPDPLAAMGGLVYFGASDSGGRSLWKTDGTSGGTTLVRRFAGAGPVAPMAAAGGQLFFSASDDTAMLDKELWKSDGTEGGTVRVKDINPGPPGSNIQSLTELGGKVVFFAETQLGGNFLWVSDGSENGTMPLSAVSGSATEIVRVANLAFFTVGVQKQLWQTDGTSAGTHPTLELAPTTLGAYPLNLTRAAGRLFFEASTDSVQDYAFVTDGTSAGTIRLSCPTCVAAGGTVPFKGKAFFSQADSGVVKLWSSDGTAEGTRPFGDSGPASIGESCVAGSNLFFLSGKELWKTDGTLQGTVRVMDAGVDYPFALAALGSSVFFENYDQAHGWELWKSDGTKSGTSILKDIVPGPGDGLDFGFPTPFGAGNALLFTASDGANGFQLWRTDGTEGGTTPLKDIVPGPGGFARLDSVTYFFEASADPVLWKSDGTPEGTLPVAHLPHAPYFFPHDLISFNGRLYFGAFDHATGDEFWTSDGTEVGTHILVDINSGNGNSHPHEFVQGGDELYFVADDAVHGEEIWKTDGTREGTQLAGEVAPGPTSSHPASLAVSGNQLFFRAFEPSVGYELWAIPICVPGVPCHVVTGTGSNGTPRKH